MKVVFVYGPPAVGKATVARELSLITGFRYFMNHQASDPVQAILDFEDNPSLFRGVANEVKKVIMGKAIEIGLPGLIITFCYSPPDADHNLRETMNFLNEKGAEMLFIKLCCEDNELFRRVQDPTRKLMSAKKLTNIEDLKEAIEKHGFKKQIPYVESLPIDTTSLLPWKAAEIIAKHYNLTNKYTLTENHAPTNKISESETKKELFSKSTKYL